MYNSIYFIPYLFRVISVNDKILTIVCSTLFMIIKRPFFLIISFIKYSYFFKTLGKDYFFNYTFIKPYISQHLFK